VSPKLVNHQDKKEKIILATIDVLSEKGSTGFRIIDVANKLNMGKSTIYEYFVNKQDLLEKALEYYLLEIYLPETNDNYSFIEELNSTIEQIITSSEVDLKKYLVLIDIFYQGINGDFSKMDQFYQEYMSYMIKKFKKDQENGLVNPSIDPEAFVLWVGATFDGITVQLLVKKDLPLIKKAFYSFLKAIKKYIE